MGGEHEDYRDMIDVGLDKSSGLEGECLFTGLLMFDMKSTSTTMQGRPGVLSPRYYVSWWLKLCIFGIKL